MAAITEEQKTRKNYYRISYGMLSSSSASVPEGFTEISEKDLKSKTLDVQEIDLRKKYVDKGTGDYPYKVFYSAVKGTVQKIEREDYDKGISLNVSILDQDDEISVLQTGFYSKVASDFLNRLANISNSTSEITFSPYSVTSDAVIEGKKIKFYNSGVSLKEEGKKVERKFKSDEIPSTERVQDNTGKLVTSRVKQNNFLYEYAIANFPEVAVDTQLEPAKTEEATDNTPQPSVTKEQGVKSTSKLPF